MDEPHTVRDVEEQEEAELRAELENRGWRLEVGGNDEWTVVIARRGRTQRKLATHRTKLDALSVARESIRAGALD